MAIITKFVISPEQETVAARNFFSSRHTCVPAAWGLRRSRDRSLLVLHLGEQAGAGTPSAVSVRQIFLPGQTGSWEVLSLSHSPCHFGLLFFKRCSIKSVQSSSFPVGSHPILYFSFPLWISPLSLLICQRGQPGSQARPEQEHSAHCYATDSTSILGQPRVRRHICVTHYHTRGNEEKWSCWRGR